MRIITEFQSAKLTNRKQAFWSLSILTSYKSKEASYNGSEAKSTGCSCRGSGFNYP